MSTCTYYIILQSPLVFFLVRFTGAPRQVCSRIAVTAEKRLGTSAAAFLGTAPPMLSLCFASLVWTLLALCSHRNWPYPNLFARSSMGVVLWGEKLPFHLVCGPLPSQLKRKNGQLGTFPYTAIQNSLTSCLLNVMFYVLSCVRLRRVTVPCCFTANLSV